MSDLTTTLNKVMRSLRAHGEHELAGEVADLLLNPPQPMTPTTAPHLVGPPNLAMVPAMDLVAEFQRRHPVSAMVFEHPIEGQSFSGVRVVWPGTGNIVTGLGLLEWGAHSAKTVLAGPQVALKPGSDLNGNPS